MKEGACVRARQVMKGLTPPHSVRVFPDDPDKSVPVIFPGKKSDIRRFLPEKTHVPSPVQSEERKRHVCFLSVVPNGFAMKKTHGPPVRDEGCRPPRPSPCTMEREIQKSTGLSVSLPKNQEQNENFYKLRSRNNTSQSAGVLSWSTVSSSSMMMKPSWL